MPIRLVAAIITVFAAGLAAGGILGSTRATGAHQAVSQTLDAGFDADGNIYLTYLDGTRIGLPNPPGTVVPSGTYTIDLDNNSLDDLGNPHSFHLSGPGVNLAAGGVVQATWTATFLPSASYVYSDDDNPGGQHDVFGTPGSGATLTTVTASPTTTGANSGTAPKPTNNNPLTGKPAAKAVFRGTLVATVGATVTLTVGGKPVRSLKSGRYRISVTDKSKKGGFTIQRIKQAATTLSGVSFVGKRSRTLDLTPGQWFFHPTFVGRKSYFAVVSA